jgi:hypothetical protein
VACKSPFRQPHFCIYFNQWTYCRKNSRLIAKMPSVMHSDALQ